MEIALVLAFHNLDFYKRVLHLVDEVLLTNFVRCSPPSRPAGWIRSSPDLVRRTFPSQDSLLLRIPFPQLVASLLVRVVKLVACEAVGILCALVSQFAFFRWRTGSPSVYSYLPFNVRHRATGCWHHSRDRLHLVMKTRPGSVIADTQFATPSGS